MKQKQICLLLVESNSEIARKDTADLKKEGYSVFTVHNGKEAVEQISDNAEIEIVLMDIYLDGTMNGVETAERVRQKYMLPILFRADEIYPVLLKKSISISSCGYVSRSGINSLLIASIDSTVNHFREKSDKISKFRQDQELLNLFLEFNPSYVFFKDHEIKSLKLSKNYEKMLGLPIEDLLGKTMFELFPSDLAKSMDADDKNILLRGVPIEVEEELNNHFYTTTKFPIIRTDAPPLLAGFTIDITRRVQAENKLRQEILERKLAEEELLNLRRFLSNIIDSMPSMLIAVDSVGIVTQWNIEALHKTGIAADDAVGQPLENLIPRLSKEMQRIGTAIKTGQKQFVLKKSRKEGDRTIYEDVIIYPLISNGIPGAVIRVDDVTENVLIDELMVQSEKMLSVGGLAAGMAHEINNPLAGMIQTVNVMEGRLWEKIDLPINRKTAEEVGLDLDALKKFMEKRDIPQMFDTITSSGMRIAEIVRNMLSFARKGDGEILTYNLLTLIDRTLVIAETDYDIKKHYDFKKIELVKEYDESLPEVSCEGPKIQQVLLNLLRNGSEAMGESGTKDPRFIIRTVYDKKRNLAVIEIEDNGPGIKEEIRKRIFEPFYTAKPNGAGTGLGLSVSYFIITENHNGEMTVESEPGNGTKFIIRLPIN